MSGVGVGVCVGSDDGAGLSVFPESLDPQVVFLSLTQHTPVAFPSFTWTFK